MVSHTILNDIIRKSINVTLFIWNYREQFCTYTELIRHCNLYCCISFIRFIIQFFIRNSERTEAKEVNAGNFETMESRRFGERISQYKTLPVSFQSIHNKIYQVVIFRKGRISVLMFFLIIFLFMGLNGGAQTENTERDSLLLSVNADLVSRYIWRGQNYSTAPCIQPTVVLDWKNFELGGWGSYGFSGTDELESDLYLSKTMGPVTAAVWDYFCFNDTAAFDYFDYGSANTGHLLEAQLLLSGGEKIPFNLLGGYFFYGSDPSNSLYLELQYQYSKGSTEIEAFAGYQATGDFYAETPSFVNVGCSVTKPLHITDSWELPICVSLILNPDARSFYLVGAITF